MKFPTNVYCQLLFFVLAEFISMVFPSVNLSSPGLEIKPIHELESNPPTHHKLEKYLMAHYNNRLIPRRDPKAAPMQVYFSIGLYQIIEVNEPQEWLLLNCWIVERWEDDFLYWNPDDFNNVTQIVLPRALVWIPDTTLYNSVIMDDAKSRRIQSVKVTTQPSKGSALVEMLYPTLHKFSCVLDLRYFPFDIQKCTMTFGSWIHDNKAIDYYAHVYPVNYNSSDNLMGLGVEHCIENEGWNILNTEVERHEVKFKCCATPYTLLDFYLTIQRKPLFYFVNLIIPSLMISLISLVGFFSSPTMNDVREEKINMGITTLLSMSILIFMVADKMPSTSSFIPLIGWFYTSMVMLISGGTLAGSFVIFVQKKGIMGERPSCRSMLWAKRAASFLRMEMPLLMKQAYKQKAKQDKLAKQRQLAELSVRQRLGGLRKKSITQLFQKISSSGLNQKKDSTAYYPTIAKGLAALTSTTSTAARRGSGTLAGIANPTTSEPKTSATTSLVDVFIDEEQKEKELKKTDSNISLDKLAELIVHMKYPVAIKPLAMSSGDGSINELYGYQFEKDNRGREVDVKKIQRNLAQIEYDWLAAVVEKIFFILFCTLFFLMSFGINGIGLLHWSAMTDEVPNR